MVESQEEVLKLKDFLKKRGLQLSDSEIESIAQNLYALGRFIVRLKVKKVKK